MERSNHQCFCSEIIICFSISIKCHKNHLSLLSERPEHQKRTSTYWTHSVCNVCLTYILFKFPSGIQAPITLCLLFQWTTQWFFDIFQCISLSEQSISEITHKKKKLRYYQKTWCLYFSSFNIWNIFIAETFHCVCAVNTEIFTFLR